LRSKFSTCAVRFHLVISITFFTARFAQGAEVAEKKYYFFSADPRGIGSAFHGAGTAEKK
jgi:hypothetical protein